MPDYAEEQWGDSDEKLLKHLKDYGYLTGYIENGDEWTLKLYRDGDEANGRELIEIKGVKLWHSIRATTDLPVLPTIPPFPPYDE